MDLEPFFFLVIVMEYCPEGDLSSRIADAYGRDIDSDEDEIDEDQLSPLPDTPMREDVVLPVSTGPVWAKGLLHPPTPTHAHNISLARYSCIRGCSLNNGLLSNELLSVSSTLMFQ